MNLASRTFSQEVPGPPSPTSCVGWAWQRQSRAGDSKIAQERGSLQATLLPD